MEVVEILKELSVLGFTPFNLVLLGILYALGIQTGLFPRFWKKTDDEATPTLKDIHEIMTHLKAHYNDETTENLEKIGRNQETMIGGIKDIRENQKVIAKDVDELKQSHAIIKEFGVKVRKST
jgi:hypothetical protein